MCATSNHLLTRHSKDRTERRAAKMSKLPQGTKHAIVGLLIGTAYGIAMSALWRGKGGMSGTGGAVKSHEALRPRVICFGDSLTQYGYDAERLGWLSLLAHWWERRFDVVNRGFSGYNTRWLMPLVEKIFVLDRDGNAQVKLVTIFLGANDSVLPGNHQHVPLAEYKANLKRMTDHVRMVHPEARVVLITPPPIHEDKWKKNREEKGMEMDRQLDVTWSYAIACAEVGHEVGATVVDAYKLLGSGSQTAADGYLHDGLHFTAEGNRRLFDGVKAEILTSYPELDPDNESGEAFMQAPHFSMVDPENLAESVLRGL